MVKPWSSPVKSLGDSSRKKCNKPTSRVTWSSACRILIAWVADATQGIVTRSPTSC